MEKKPAIKRGTKRDFEDSYKLQIELASGANSTVWECRGLSRHGRYAVKITETDNADDIVFLEEEFTIVSENDHENVVRGYEMFICHDKVYTVLEMVDGGELHDIINSMGKFDEDDAAALTSQLVQAVFYLHEKNICHRDIKPENILLTNDGTLKLSDFGLAVQLKSENELMKECVGTQAYQAPEVLLGLPYNKSVDMWSIGATMFTVLAGQKPFPTEIGKDLQRAKILNAEFSFSDPVWRDISKDARDFISKLLKVKPADRMTALQALQHPWLQYIDLQEFKKKWLSNARERKNMLRELTAERRKQERNNSQLSNGSPSRSNNSSRSTRSTNSESKRDTVSNLLEATSRLTVGSRSKDIKRSTTTDYNTRVVKRDKAHDHSYSSTSSISRTGLSSRDRDRSLYRETSRDSASSSTRYSSQPVVPTLPTRSVAISVSSRLNTPTSARDTVRSSHSYSPSSTLSSGRSGSSYKSSSSYTSTYTPRSTDYSSSSSRRRPL